MPDPISSSRPVYDTCDPSTACCNDPLPAEARTSAQSVTPTSTPPAVVTLDPVVVTGDAGARELIRQYDSRSCAAQTKSAALSCLALGVAIRNAAIADPVTATISAFQSALTCGKELRALYDCEEQAAARSAAVAQIVDDCHERGGVVKAGETRSGGEGTMSEEVVCEVP